jgi:hypothetical protein
MVGRIIGVGMGTPQPTFEESEQPIPVRSGQQEKSPGLEQPGHALQEGPRGRKVLQDFKCKDAVEAPRTVGKLLDGPKVDPLLAG